MSKISQGMVEAGVAALSRARKGTDEAVVASVFSAMDKRRDLEEVRRNGQPAPKYEHQAFPSWRYGPNGEARVFNSPEEVPPGWGEEQPALGAALRSHDHERERALDAADFLPPRRGRPPKVKPDASPAS